MEATLIHAVILGIVQGVTEFLPVSSTAHLAVLPRVLGWKTPLLNSLSFDVALHAGTLIALLAVFGAEWARMVPALLHPRSRPGRTAWGLGLAVIPAAIAGAFLEDRFAGPLREPGFVALFLAVGAILLWWADARGGGRGRVGSTTLRMALLIGFAQAFALLPGLSRSGITITAGLLLGLSRSESARYSFLLSTPLLLGALAWEARHFSGFAPGEWAAVLAGTVAAAAAGFASIRLLLRLVRGSGYAPYAVYRLLLAALIALWALA